MLKLSDNIYCEGDDKSQIIVDVSRGKFFELNTISYDIVNLIIQNKTEKEMANFISSKYTVEAEVALHDIKVFIQQLIEMGILESC